MFKKSSRAALGAVAALALVFAAAACKAGVKTASAGGVTATLSEFSITTTGTAPAGQPFSIAVHNAGQVPHSLAVDVEANTVSTPELNGGAAATLAVPALASGVYKLYCTVAGHRASGMEARLAVGTGTAAAASDAQHMELMEKEAVASFPAKTAGSGGQVDRGVLKNGVRTFSLSVAPTKWEVTPGEVIDAYSYNGQVPGPELHVRKGERVKVVVHNYLPESTVVHFHGLTLPNPMDGVPYITQEPIAPSGTFTYRFKIVDQPGTYMYHSHMNAVDQVGKGLLGTFVIDPPKKNWNVEQTIVLGDGPLGYTLNGKGFPATAPIVAKYDSRVLIRFLNAGQMLHPMHLHGFHFTVINRDGYKTDPYTVDTLVIAPGERYDVIFEANHPGTWAFHCHILSHVEGPHGMHGMVTAVVVS